MNKNEFLILSEYSRGVSQRELSKRTSFSLGKVNQIIAKLKKDGLLDYRKEDLLKEFKVSNAIILAAGLGSRMFPINDDCPKPLISINGEILIERTIRQLIEKGITNINIVVGYKKELFEYLIDKFDVRLIVNPLFMYDHNIKSLYAAIKLMGNSYIVPGDIYFRENPFSQYEYCSYYTLGNETKDYGYYSINNKGRLIIGKKNYYDAVGLCYLNKTDSVMIKSNITKLINENADTYWESCLFTNGFSIEAKLINVNQYSEINTYENLRELDNDSNNLNNDNIKTIMEVFDVRRDEIKNISISKKGMTNRSFLFEINNKRYIMRIPGEGTDKLINRQHEYEVYKIVSNLGISDRVVYMNPSNGVKITEFFEGCRNCDSTKIGDLKIAMKKLKEFHDLKLQINFEFDLFGQIIYYEQLMGGKSLYPDYEQVKDYVFELKEFVDRVKLPYQLCHIDSVPDNFLIGEKETKLIDWEYASNQDPHLDIAMFCIYSLYNKAEIDQLIDIYFDNSCEEIVRLKIYSYIAIGGLLWSNWCEYKHHLGVEFGEYSLMQYRYGKEYSKLVLEQLKK